MSAKNATPAGGAFGGALAQQAGIGGFNGAYPSGSLGIMSNQDTQMGPPFGRGPSGGMTPATNFPGIFGLMQRAIQPRSTPQGAGARLPREAPIFSTGASSPMSTRASSVSPFFR